MITASALPVLHLFSGDRTYRVPTFQRPYRWWLQDFENVETLFQDVAEVARLYLTGDRAENAEHFLGSVLLKKRTNKLGYYEWMILDGQQRMLTLAMLLRAISFLRAERPDTHIEDPELLLWTRPHGVVNLRPRLLASRADRPDYDAALKSETATGEEKARGHLCDALARLTERLRGFCQEAESFDTALSAFDYVTRNKLKIVIIEIGDNVAPNLAFKRLNAAGEDLSTLDLMKNDLFEKFEAARGIDGGSDDGPVNELYDANWRPLDEPEALTFWSLRYTRGPISGIHSDWMVRELLRAELGRSDVRISEVRKRIQALIESRADQPERLIREIAKAAEVYFRLERAVRPRQAQPGDAVVWGDPQSAVLRLMLRVESHAPLIAAEALGDDPAAAATVRQMIEDYAVRCFFTRYEHERGLPTDRLLRAMRDARQNGDDMVAAVRTVLGGANWPDDATFREGWRTLPVFILKPDSEPKGSAARTVLRRLLSVRDPESAERLAAIGTPDAFTVEHLWPQTGANRWPPAPAGELIHTIGNLSLCSRLLNEELANETWEEKKKILRAKGESADHRELTQIATWDEAAIRTRSDTLLETALSLWPGPK